MSLYLVILNLITTLKAKGVSGRVVNTPVQRRLAITATSPEQAIQKGSAWFESIIADDQLRDIEFGTFKQRCMRARLEPTQVSPSIEAYPEESGVMKL